MINFFSTRERTLPHTSRISNIAYLTTRATQERTNINSDKLFSLAWVGPGGSPPPLAEGVKRGQ